MSFLFEQIIRENSITDNSDKKTRRRQSKLSQSEVMCIMIMFHAHNARHLKHFYIHYVQKHLQSEFPETVSYNRFVELQQKAAVPLVIFLKTMCLGQCTGVSFIDSTPLRVCHTKRENQHKTFKGMATKGKSTMGWFYGFKLHLIINDRGEILDFMLTQANVDDREPLKSSDFHKRIFGKLFGDRGYISQDLFEKLFVDGVFLVSLHTNSLTKNHR